MGQTKVRSPEGVVERNIILSGKIMHFLIENPQVFNSLPENFELVILPDDDPDIRRYNLELLDKYGSENKPIVFARIKVHPENLEARMKPSIFVPVNVTA